MKIAINGFGRIGRTFFRQAFSHPDMEVVAINDLGDKENLLYLLRHDSVYRSFDISDEQISQIKFLQERDPANLPWKDLEIDVVVESTGFFVTYEKSKAHLDAGAKRVVISAPAKDPEDEGENHRAITFTPNVGIDAVAKGKITSNASCTTNSLTPVVATMLENPGIKKGALTTIHGYTSTQALVDGPCAKDFRRGRAAASNIIPASTGAAIATAKAIPAMEGKFDGVAMRVPVIAGSISDFTFISERPTSVEEINNIFKEASQKTEWQGILTVAEEPIVSSDILGKPYGATVDLSFTRVIDGDLVKVFSWYDNEWGYCAMLVKHIETLKNYL